MVCDPPVSLARGAFSACRLGTCGGGTAARWTWRGVVWVWETWMSNLVETVIWGTCGPSVGHGGGMGVVGVDEHPVTPLGDPFTGPSAWKRCGELTRAPGVGVSVHAQLLKGVLR